MSYKRDGQLARYWGQGQGPAAVLACLPGELHDLGLLAFGITRQRQGWHSIYLGPDTPIATIRHAIGGRAPRPDHAWRAGHVTLAGEPEPQGVEGRNPDAGSLRFGSDGRIPAP